MSPNPNMTPTDINNEININYIDLFSGIGGFRVAIEDFDISNKKYNFNCVLSADIKPDAIDTYNINFNENNKAIDINLLEPSDIKQFDLLCAGFLAIHLVLLDIKEDLQIKKGNLYLKS